MKKRIGEGELLDDEKKHRIFRTLRGAVKKCDRNVVKKILSKIPNRKDLEYISSTTDFDMDESICDMVHRLMVRSLQERHEYRVYTDSIQESGNILTISQQNQLDQVESKVVNFCCITMLIVFAAGKGKYPCELIE